MILRGLAGLLIGIGYGVLMGALTFLLWRITHDPAHPGPMIPDDNGWRLIATIVATFIAGVCGALVGLLVSLTRANKGRGGIIGFAVGVVVLLLVFLNSWKVSWREWHSLLSVSDIYLLFLPIGLALTGMVVSIIAGKLKA